MNINTLKIKDEYGSLAAFCDIENINRGVFYNLIYKKSLSFRRTQNGEASGTRKAYEKLKRMGYLLDEVVNP